MNLKKLEVGSGNRPRPGFLHLDINPNAPDLDYCCSMDDIPVENNTFDEVWSTHVIEHLPFDQTLKAIQEWHRVLKPFGMCHIDTPNIRRNVDLYLNGGWERDFAILTPEEQERLKINGVPNKTLWLNFKTFSSSAQWDVHYGNFDPELLTEYCKLAGFSRVEVYQTEPSVIVRAWK